MDQPSLYDDGIVTWAEQQAAGLRVLAARPELSNTLDWENLADEVKSVGRSPVQAVDKPPRPDPRASFEADLGTGRAGHLALAQRDHDLPGRRSRSLRERHV